MSYTELQSGKIKVIGKMLPEESDDYIKGICEHILSNKYEEIMKDGFPCYWNGWIDVFNSEMDNDEMFVYTNGTLYHIYDVKNHDVGGYFCEVNKTDDDEYRFITQYYNGGTCLPEIMEEECEKL